MKTLFLKYPGYVFYAALLALLNIVNLSASEPSRADLLAQLINRLGPKKAAEFMARLEERHAQMGLNQPQEQIKDPAAPVSISEAPQTTETAAVSASDSEQTSVKKTTFGFAITTQERHHFDQIISKLETYAHGVHRCIEAFFNKKNTDPYRNHVQCFKTQLHYLQEELLNQFPHAETADGSKIFKSLAAITQAVEKSQSIMCATLDANYGTGMFSGAKLGVAMNGIKGTINNQRSLIDKEIGAIRNQLRNAHEQAMLKKLNSMYALFNKNFDYGVNKKSDELLSILNLRVKQ